MRYVPTPQRQVKRIGATFSELAFNFRLTFDLMGWGLLFGAIIGFVGSLLPSIRASRLRIVEALRA